MFFLLKRIHFILYIKSKARNKLLGLQMSIAVQNDTNDGNNKTHIRCLNAEPEIPKCEVCAKI